MRNKSIKEKIAKVAASKPSKWKEQAEWRKKNKAWLQRSFKIAVRVLQKLREIGMTQKELAKRIDVSPQHVSKILKGKENLTLETIAKLEGALDIPLIEVMQTTSFNLFESYDIPETLLCGETETQYVVNKKFRKPLEEHSSKKQLEHNYASAS